MLDHTNHTPRRTDKSELPGLSQLGLPPPPINPKAESLASDSALLRKISELCVGFGITNQQPIREPAIAFELKARLENGYLLHVTTNESTMGPEVTGTVEIYHDHSSVGHFNCGTAPLEVRGSNYQWTRDVFEKISTRIVKDLMNPSLSQSFLREMRQIYRKDDLESASQRIEGLIGQILGKNHDTWEHVKIRKALSVKSDSAPGDLGSGFMLSITDAQDSTDYTLCTRPTKINIILINKMPPDDPRRLIFQEDIPSPSERIAVQVSLTRESTNRLTQRLWQIITPRSRGLARASEPVIVLPQRSVKV